MDNESSGIAKFSLRGKSIEELRNLAGKYVSIETEDINSLERNQLISLISRASNKSSDLAAVIERGSIAFKPSFYLMVLAPSKNVRPPQESAIGLLRESFFQQDDWAAKRSSVPTTKNFKVEKLIEHDDSVIEIRLTWQKIHWYWAPIEVIKSHLYELQFGIAILDFSSRKAIIACHNERERDSIVNAVKSAYGVRLSPLVLTRRLLDQIGTFDFVRRASYFVSDPNPNTPSNITYADDKLATRSIARAEENDRRSERKHSFYLIPLTTIEEQGVGVTSDSGKLWISREVPLESVREYGIALLGRVGRTIDAMTDRGEYYDVLRSMGIPKLPKMSQIKNARLRRDIYHLLEHIVNMLLNKEDSRAFNLSEGLLSDGVPKYFNYPRLQLVDPETNDVAYWIDSEQQSQLIKPSRRIGELALIGHPSKEELDLLRTRHPITGNLLEIHYPIESLHLIPTELLHETLLEAIRHIATQINELESVDLLPFQIHGNHLLLDFRRAFGKTGLGINQTNIAPHEVVEFRSLMKRTVNQSDRDRLVKQLHDLGEKCKHMSDDNCQMCKDDAKYLCLILLVARHLRDHLLLAHKGIELSDIQGTVHILDDKLRIFGFAKKAPGKNSSLTARNKNGAVLLGQVVNQADKTTFNTVAIITPSTINEDLRDRLEMICGLLSKRILFIDLPVLLRMLKYFEDQAEFEDVDVEKIYIASAK